MIKKLTLGGIATGFLIIGASAQIGPLPGMAVLPPPTSSTPPSGTFITNDINTSGGTTITFSSENIGATDPTRIVAVAVCIGNGNTTGNITDPTAVTIGGVSATKAGSGSPSPVTGSPSADVTIWYASLTTGTTANIVISAPAVTTRAGIGIFRLINLSSSTPFANNSNLANGTSVSANLNVPSTGIVIAAVCNASGSPPTYTWTASGLTKEYDQNITGSGQQSAAFGSGLSASTPLSVSVTATTTTNLSIADASWH